MDEQEKALNAVAKEFGMSLDTPYWPEDEKTYTFRTGTMDDRCCWIHHIFHFADSPEHAVALKIAAREAQ